MRPLREALLVNVNLNSTGSAVALAGRAVIEAVDAQTEALLERLQESEQRAEERHRELLGALVEPQD